MTHLNNGRPAFAGIKSSYIQLAHKTNEKERRLLTSNYCLTLQSAMSRMGIAEDNRANSTAIIHKTAFLPEKVVPTNRIICGDCESILKTFPDNSIDLIVTSPPYVDRRKNTYGGVPPNKYVEWFLPKTAEFLRVLKPTGTFILNIKAKVYN